MLAEFGLTHRGALFYSDCFNRGAALFLATQFGPVLRAGALPCVFLLIRVTYL